MLINLNYKIILESNFVIIVIVVMHYTNPLEENDKFINCYFCDCYNCHHNKNLITSVKCNFRRRSSKANTDGYKRICVPKNSIFIRDVLHGKMLGTKLIHGH